MGSVTEYKLPTGDSGVAFTRSTGTQNFANVDDPIGSPDDNDYNYRADTNATDQFTFTAYVLANVVSVYNCTTQIRVKQLLGAAKARTAATVNGTLYTGSTVGDANWNNFTTIRTTNPDTSAAWVPADVKGTGANPLQKFGYRANLSAGQTVGVSQCFHSCTFEEIEFKSVTDSGSGTDTVSAPTVSARLTDTGVGVDVVNSLTVTLSMSDTGTGLDSVNGSAHVSVSDIGAGVDSIENLIAGLLVGDTGVGVDSVIGIVAGVSVTDAGIGTDGPYVSVDVAVTDAGAGLDGVVINAEIEETDAGAGQDSITQILNSLSVADTGSGADSIAQILNSLNVTDSGTGTDSVLKRELASGKLTISFTIKKPGVTITTK